MYRHVTIINKITYLHLLDCGTIYTNYTCISGEERNDTRTRSEFYIKTLLTVTFVLCFDVAHLFYSMCSQNLVLYAK